MKAIILMLMIASSPVVADARINYERWLSRSKIAIDTPLEDESGAYQILILLINNAFAADIDRAGLAIDIYYQYVDRDRIWRNSWNSQGRNRFYTHRTVVDRIIQDVRNLTDDQVQAVGNIYNGRNGTGRR